jgi:hypothetical protein
VLACWSLMEPTPARAADSRMDLTPLSKKLEKLVVKHYPDASYYMRCDGSLHFEHRTRIFMIHQPDKFGEWQDACEEPGPKNGGILCTIELRDGKYNGAAVVPQEFDLRYFTLYLAAPYSKKLDQHLYVQLKCPKDVSKEFLKEFNRLVKDFDRTLLGEEIWW